MSNIITQHSRIINKRTELSGVTATVPTSNDFTDGTWITTDIYSGELYFNIPDKKIFTRFGGTIQQIYPQDSGSTYQDVYTYSAYTALPATGELNVVYITADENKIYRWDNDAIVYKQIATSSATTYWSSIIDAPSASTTLLDLAVLNTHSVSAVNNSHYTKAQSDALYVAIVAGSGLTQNSFTDAYKLQLDEAYNYVEEYVDNIAFPAALSALTNKLYIDKSTNIAYRYNPLTTGYTAIQTSTALTHQQDTDLGTTNQWFTIGIGISGIELYGDSEYMLNIYKEDSALFADVTAANVIGNETLQCGTNLSGLTSASAAVNFVTNVATGSIRLTGSTFQYNNDTLGAGTWMNFNQLTTFTPSGSGDTAGVEGQLNYDDDYLYVKNSIGWNRIALSW